MINHCVLAGNLTREVELKQTQGGTSIINFGIAVNERVKNNQTGQWEDRPNFFECVCFGKRADGLAKVLSKGQKIAVSGHLRYNSWEAKDGSKRSKVEVVVDDVEFMSQRRDNAQSQQNGSYGQQYQQQGNYSNQQQYSPQNGYQQPTGGYQQPMGGYQQQYQEYQDDLYSENQPF